MKQKSLLRKSAVVSIIFIFISITLAPTIYASVDQEKDMTEITIEVIGRLRVKPQTIKITREQAEDLDRLFDNLKEQLNNVESKQEVIEIFNNAIIEIDELGFLPDNLNIKLIQRSITSRYFPPNIGNRIQSNYGMNPIDLDDVDNALCLMAGSTRNMYVEGPAARLFEALANMFNRFDVLFFSSLFLRQICMIYAHRCPLPIANTIGYGYDRFGQYPIQFAAGGWVFTYGTNDKKIAEGGFYGRLPFQPIFLSYSNIGTSVSYVGAIGFSGLKISNSFRTAPSEHLYLGSALLVSVGNEPPDI